MPSTAGRQLCPKLSDVEDSVRLVRLDLVPGEIPLHELELLYTG